MGNCCPCFRRSGSKYESFDKPPHKKVSNWTSAQLDSSDDEEVVKTDREWKKCLTKEQYKVCRLGETEQPWVGKYVHTNDKGRYACVCCRTVVFSSDAKFTSETGWPTFHSPASEGLLAEKEEQGFNTHVDVICRKCHARLGRVYNDGPKPSGKRYCINSVALRFHAAPKEAAS